MAKKKQSKPQQQTLSPVRFLKERVRQVPIYKCYLCKDLEEGTEGTVMVVRKHTGDKYTCGLYLIDKYCVGVKDASYHLRMDEMDFEEFLERFKQRFEPRECTYAEAHNWVWGAVGFAEDAGIAPCKEFDLAQYVLAEDDDEIELIEYDFGDEDGRHCLLANGRLEASTYLPLMHKNLGEEFTFCLGPHDQIHEPMDWNFEKNCPNYDDSDAMVSEYDDEDDLDYYDDEVEYSQVHPEYPKELHLKNTDIAEVLSCADPKLKTNDQIDAFLTREGLREDLEQYVLYHIGRTNDTAFLADPSLYDNEEYYNCNMMQAVRLLAEVGDEHSLEVILEGLRQSRDFYDFHYSDAFDVAYVPCLVRLGAKHLDKLMSFAKEPGLYDMAHFVVIAAVGVISCEYPELRNDVKEWFKELLTYFIDKMESGDATHCSRTLMGFMLTTLMDIDSEELLPLIKEVYEKDLVNEDVCGTYVNVATTILNNNNYTASYDTDIHKFIAWYHLTYEDSK